MRRSMLQFFADDPRQRLAADRLAGRKDRRLDAIHPFAPARLRRQMIQLPIKQTVVWSAFARSSLCSRRLRHRRQSP